MTQQHDTRAHSPLGASGAHRWIACPGSVAAQAAYPDTSNKPADRGTAAHELAEKCLNNGFDAERFLGETITVNGVDYDVDETMVDGVQLYLDTCRGDVEPGDVWMIERKFDLSHLHPGMFGTSDWAAYLHKEKRLIVRDYKNGFGLVSEIDNAQLKFYGLGALHEVTKQGHVVDKVTLGIVQPNAPHVRGGARDETIDVLDLLDFEYELIAAARRTEDPNAPRIAGDHCEYCRAAHDCPVLTMRQRQLAQSEFDPIPEINIDRLAELLDAAVMMDARIKAAWGLAHQLAEQGIAIPGYKLVERKTRRKWRHEEADTVATLKMKYALADDDIYVRKLLSPAQIEKAIPKPRGQADAIKAEFNKAFVVRPPAGTTLARDVDPRAELSGGSALLDFVPVDQPATLF